MKLTEKVSFDLIRYANCWEDADVLLEGLKPVPGSKILSIGSAGDNSFSLLITDPELVLAVDISKIQIYLIELKKIFMQHLPYHDYLSFLGFQPSNNRENVFNEIKSNLSEEVRLYWQRNIQQIKEGIIFQGKFEQYFQLFSNKILRLIHSKNTINKLLSNKDAEDQKIFYTKQWNTWRWRVLFKIFFSKYIMGKFGRDPEFLREVKIPVGEYIYKQTEKHLQSIYSQNNFILHYNLTGSFGNLLPHYLQPGNFEKIKSNLNKLQLKVGYAEDFLKENGPFRYMNLSNIFEYMDNNQFTETSKLLIDSIEPNGRIAYWNLMVSRKISEIFSEQMEYLEILSQQLTTKDKGFFYNQIIIDQKK